MLGVMSVTEEAERQLRELYGERMLGYGVRAMGCECECECHDEDPDTQMFVVLSDGFNRDIERRRVSNIASLVGGAAEAFLLITPISEEERSNPPNDGLGQEIREAVWYG